MRNSNCRAVRSRPSISLKGGLTKAEGHGDEGVRGVCYDEGFMRAEN